MNSEFHPQSGTGLVLRSFSLNFRMFPTFLALGLICCLGPIVVLVLGVVALAANMQILGIIVLLAGFLLFLAAYAYFFAATTLAVWLRLTGVKARAFQIVRRLHGKVAWKVVAVGYRVGLKVLFGFFLLIIPGLIWYSKYVMTVPAVVVEQVYGRQAMDRSSDLAAGYRWRLLGAFIFFLVIYEAIELGTTYGLAPLLIALGAPQEWAKVIQVIGSLVSMAFIPASSIFPVLVYFDLRNRKEAITLPTIRDVDSLGAVVGI